MPHMQLASNDEALSMTALAPKKVSLTKAAAAQRLAAAAAPQCSCREPEMAAYRLAAPMRRSLAALLFRPNQCLDH
jgi:hypothetical protein